MTTVYIGVIPGKKLPTGKPFRTDVDGQYDTLINRCERICKLNGGSGRYFFIEERWWIEYPGKNHMWEILKKYTTTMWTRVMILYCGKQNLF